MSNKLLVFASQIRNAANQLEIEAKTNKDVYVDENEDTKEQSQYRAILNKMIQDKELFPYIEEIVKVLANPMLINKRIPSITLVKNIQQRINQIKDSKSTGSTQKSIKTLEKDFKPAALLNYVINFIRKIENISKSKPNFAKSHPTYKLLIEFLNYLAVYKMIGLKRLVSQNNKFYQTFNPQKEKQQLNLEKKKNEK